MKISLIVGLLLFCSWTGGRAGTPACQNFHDPDDYMLEKEDQIYRDAEDFTGKANVILGLLERRLLVLSSRHLQLNPKTMSKKMREELIKPLLDYTDDRLLRDYNQALRKLLGDIDSRFRHSRGRIMYETLSQLKKKTGGFAGLLGQLEPVLSKSEDCRLQLSEAITLTQKANAGAIKGLDGISL